MLREFPGMKIGWLGVPPRRRHDGVRRHSRGKRAEVRWGETGVPKAIREAVPGLDGCPRATVMYASVPFGITVFHSHLCGQ